MKKLFIIPLLILVLTLGSCSNKNTNQLEEKIKEFDYYTEIFDFEDRYNNIKLLAAYNNGDSELTYIYYVDEIEVDKEIIVFHGEEIIYEDFIVDDYEEDDQLLGTFKTSDFTLEEDNTKVEFKLIQPGFLTPDSYVGTVVAQEFHLIKNISDIDVLEKEFLETTNYQDKELELEVFSRLKNVYNRTSTVILISGAVIYILGLYLYRKYYQNQITKQLTEETKKRFLPDLDKFMLGYLVIVIILTFISMGIASRVVDNSLNKFEFYNEHELNYESVESDKINIRFGANYATTYDTIENGLNQMAFFEKVSSHRIIGYVTITTGEEYPVRTVIPSGSYGGYSYKLIYRHLNSNEMEINVYDTFYGEQEISYTRQFKYSYWGE